MCQRHILLVVTHFYITSSKFRKIEVKWDLKYIHLLRRNTSLLIDRLNGLPKNSLADQKLLGKASKFQNIIFVLIFIFFLFYLGVRKGFHIDFPAREAKVS